MTKSNSTISKPVDNSKTKSKQSAQNDETKRSKKVGETVVKERSLAEDLKTDTGAASDESWEKDFDLSDQ